MVLKPVYVGCKAAASPHLIIDIAAKMTAICYSPGRGRATPVLSRDQAKQKQTLRSFLTVIDYMSKKLGTLFWCYSINFNQKGVAAANITSNQRLALAVEIIMPTKTPNPLPKKLLLCPLSLWIVATLSDFTLAIVKTHDEGMVYDVLFCLILDKHQCG